MRAVDTVYYEQWLTRNEDCLLTTTVELTCMTELMKQLFSPVLLESPWVVALLASYSTAIVDNNINSCV